MAYRDSHMREPRARLDAPPSLGLQLADAASIAARAFRAAERAGRPWPYEAERLLSVALAAATPLLAAESGRRVMAKRRRS